MLPGLVGSMVFGVVFLLSARLVRSDELATIVGAIRRRAT
jgi:hypothetical protein